MKARTPRRERGIVLAIIAGSGIDGLPDLADVRLRSVPTPYGMPSCPLRFGRIDGTSLVYLQRHGDGHTVPPHLINYRANIWALRDCGASNVVALATVGGIARELAPGALAVPDQIIDYTSGRESTYSATDAPLRHVDFTRPYAQSLRESLLEAAERIGVSVHDGGTYAATQGPRLETAAEILRLERDGAHMVGMTGMPEAVLARELGLNYATLAVVVNAAAGKRESIKGIDMAAVESTSAKAMHLALKVMRELAAQHGD